LMAVPGEEEAGWGWVRQVGRLEIGGCLTFARSVSPERVIEAFGMDPAGAVVLGIRLPEEVARGPLLTASRLNPADSASGPGATWS
jgi:hypothetical protein